MGYETTLTVLADPSRRAILDRLRDGPLPVAELAAGLPVTRPAVSKHLRLMREAGVVRVTPQGTRNLYELDRRPLDEVRQYLDGFREASLESFKRSAESSTEDSDD